MRTHFFGEAFFAFLVVFLALLAFFTALGLVAFLVAFFGAMGRVVNQAGLDRCRDWPGARRGGGSHVEARCEWCFERAK